MDVNDIIDMEIINYVQRNRREYSLLDAFEEYNDVEFEKRFRICKDTVIYLSNLLGNRLIQQKIPCCILFLFGLIVFLF